MKMIPLKPEYLGCAEFRQDYGLRFAYQAGAMANAIASTAMVIALGKAGYLGSFGAGGVNLEQLEQAIKTVQAALPNGPYLFNLLHNPDTTLENAVIDLYLRYRVQAVEAAAFMSVTPGIVYYRAAGIVQSEQGEMLAQNRVIAKVSRIEVAEKFMSPPEQKILDLLLQQEKITLFQAEMMAKLPVATDITVEANSGGHTDNQTLTCLFPLIKDLSQRLQAQYGYKRKLRVGAAGGISTPESAAAAFMLGADYIVTGSVNQSSLEAGTSWEAKNLLAAATVHDTAMCPSADMFEIGAKVQVLKRGTLYPFRAEKLYQLYLQYQSLAEIPEAELKNLEKHFFKQSTAAVWQETVDFFTASSPLQIKKAEDNPKNKIALIFRWYLGKSSNWAIQANATYQQDYQIWCGPAMGAFNARVKESYLAALENRSVVNIADFIVQGAATLFQEKADFFLCLTRGDDKVSEVEQENKVASLVSQNKLEYKLDVANMRKSAHRLNFQKSLTIFEQGKKYLPAGVHYNFGNILEDTVIPFSRGLGTRVWDMDENEHLDFFCKFGALIVGHCNPYYNAALKKYIDKLTSVDNCGLENEIGERLCELIPCAEMVRFGLSGTESVQNALRLARAYTGKNKFVRFIGHYNGNADLIMGGKPLSYERPVPVPFEQDFLGTAGLLPYVQQQHSFLIPWNDSVALEALVSYYGKDIGAIIMEPICFNGGGVLPLPGYLQRVRELCDKHNIILIFDEVITGFRVALGGAQTLLGVTPDIAVFAKALAGGGVPVSMIAGKKSIMELYATAKVAHLGTFNGYPLGLAAVGATVELLSAPGCYERMGSYLMQIAKAMTAAAKAVNFPLVIQGVPTALVFHAQQTQVEGSEVVSYDMSIKDALIRKVCRHYGLQFSPVSRIYANLMLDEADVEFFTRRIGDALYEVSEVFKHLELTAEA